MLIFPERSARNKAVHVLNNDFVQLVDFTVINQKVEHDTGFGGHRKSIKYMLSISCLEYFIAKRVKPVFDVYCTVFHSAVALQQQLSWHGLPTIYNDGVVYVSYMAVLRKFNYSTYSGAVAARKRMYPTQFNKFFNQNFIRVSFADLLLLQASARQLALSL